MKRSIYACCAVLLMLAAAGQGQTPISSPQNGVQYTRSQIKKMLHDAHAPDQYKALGSYFSDQQKVYLAQAADERQEWIQRSQNTMVLAAKYPRPADSARILYEYFTYKASEAGILSEKYDQLAIAAGTAKPQ